MEVIHLLIHHQGTRDAINKFAENYNAKLKKETPELYGKKSLKTCHINTALILKDMYSQFLLNNKKNHITDGVFRVNNQAIATKMNGGACKATAWRHVTRLLSAGVLQNKVFRGSNASYEIEFNPEVLVAELSTEFVHNYVETAKSQFGLAENCDTELDQLYETAVKAQPTFGLAENHGIITLCADTDIYKPSSNNNMHSGGMSFTVSQKTARPDADDETHSELNNSIQEQGSNGGGSLKASIAAIGNPAKEEKRKKVPPKKEKEKTPQTRSELIAEYVGFSLRFALQVLYPGQTFNDQILNETTNHLNEMFGRIQSNDPAVFQKWYSQFLSRVMLTRQYVRRRPDRFVPLPHIYFNPEFSYGFAGTRQWLKETRQRQQQKKDYYANLDLVVKCYRYYTTYPGYEAYRKACQALGKKGEGEYLDLFNECVQNESNYNHEFFKQHYENHVGRFQA